MHTIQNEVDITSEKRTDAIYLLCIQPEKVLQNVGICRDREEKLLELLNFI